MNMNSHEITLIPFKTDLSSKASQVRFVRNAQFDLREVGTLGRCAAGKSQKIQLRSLASAFQRIPRWEAPKTYIKSMKIQRISLNYYFVKKKLMYMRFFSFFFSVKLGPQTLTKGWRQHQRWQGPWREVNFHRVNFEVRISCLVFRCFFLVWVWSFPIGSMGLIYLLTFNIVDF